MKIWKYSKLDCLMLTLSLLQFVITLTFATHWEHTATVGKIVEFLLLVLMMTYNIIIISHLFTHTPWFCSERLNSIASMLNSINIGQSVQAYHLTHVRNHHKYNNDRKDENGNTKDLSSTFQAGVRGNHASLFYYAFFGALMTLRNTLFDLLSTFWLWKIGKRDKTLRMLASQTPTKREKELHQVRLDRMAYTFWIILTLSISWKWVILCYVPAFYLALAWVNLQNYFEHYGALPESKAANSVSHYGRIYNSFTFNDGFHQEHHLCPAAHWTMMPEVRRTFHTELMQQERIISPFPAIVGFFHRERKLLHTSLNPKEAQPIRCNQEVI